MQRKGTSRFWLITSSALAALLCVGCDNDSTSLTPTPTPTATPSSTPTPTVTPSPTLTPTSALSPVVTFFGITRADDVVVDSIGTTNDGLPIYQWSAVQNANVAYGFKIVIEGRPGASLQCTGDCMGTSTFAWSTADPAAMPDLQIEASRRLGNGSPAVCDDRMPTLGGVPAVTPFDFSTASAPVINDLSCRFEDGAGAYLGITDSSYACTKVPPTENYQFVGANTAIQFCAQVSQATSFPTGDTVLAARLRDIYGNVSQVSSIVIRVPAP